MGRIKAAPIKSPIAVFQPDSKYDRSMGLLNAVFGSTTETKKWIESGNPKLVGVFDKKMDPDKVKRVLEKTISANRMMHKQVG